jgi:RHS repeat-associated protein
VQFAWAQSITGLAPFAPLAGGGAEIVNLANLNVHLSIPVVHKAGRGMDFNYVLNYDSTVWTHTYPYGAWTPAPNWGWRGVSESVIGYIEYEHSSTICTHSTAYWLNAYVDAAGTTHHLSAAGPPFYGGLCNPAENYWIPSGTYVTTDGSAYSLTASVSNNVLSVTNFRDRSGNLIVAPLIDITTTNPPTNTNGPGSITDPNGNKVSTTGSVFTDTLGMNVLTVSGTNPMSYTYTGPNQTPEAVKVNYSQYTVATTFGCLDDAEYPPTQVNLVSSILLPDGTSYTFQYETLGGYYTGRISQVGLPSGGSIGYQYTGANDGIDCVDTTTAGLTRTLSDGSVWQYAQPGSGTTTVTDPSQNQTVMTTSGGAAIQTKAYQGSSSGGTLLQTVTTCYNTQSAPCTTPTGPPSNGTPRAITVVTLPTGGKSSQATTYLTSSTLPTEIDTYDFGSSSPTQKKLIAYQSLNNIVDRQSCDQVLVGTSVPSSCGTPTSNTKSLSTATYDALGNLQNMSSWISGVSSPQYLSRGFQHYSNGLLQTSTDVNNNQTTYGYQNCNNTPAYLSSVSSGGLTTSMTWDCNGGVITQVKDANSQPTNFGYVTQGGTADPFWRVLSVTDPLGDVTWNTYTTTPPTKETALAFNNDASGSDVLLTLDGLGRLAMSQVRTAPGSPSFDNTVQYGYGWNSTGAVRTQTIPGGTAVYTTQLDALGRVTSVADGGTGSSTFSYSQNDTLRTLGPAPSGENSKQKQVEYDAFGRITSVCEITSGLSGNGTCTQASSSPKGYFTTYTYDNPVGSLNIAQNAQGTPQTRSYQSDGIGRLVSETNPENGRINYTYDSDATCGSFNGDLVKTVNAANVATCSHYDAVHRRTFLSNANSNSCRFFSYDANPGFGLTESNLKGRLSGAWVGNCSTGAVTTSNLGFNYSARGDLLDTYQWSANSGGWYDVQASYWANGAMNTLDFDKTSGIDLLIPTITYGMDGEGRVSTVSGSSLQNPVTSTVYNASGQLKNVALGSGESDSYQYDANTLRMTQYNYTVDSSTVTGNLAWNANGTLNQLAITDPLNSKDAQTCNYSHGDLARLSSVNCGTTWGQTFGYDPFGNITKSGSISWQPGYNAATNRYTLAGTSYDANGNLTADTFHTYTWDGNFGNPLSIDTTNLSYDALGRLTETANGTTYRQFVYGPTGKFAEMNGQTIAKVFTALPGGDQAVYTGSNNLQGYRHSDWLGSSRFESSTTQTRIFDGAYAPFGESYADSGSDDHDFTGQIPGVVSDLYDFPFREYHPKQGRWISPDPAGVAAAHPANPQSWNRYAYVDNEPTTTIDPSGLCDVVIGGIGQSPGAPNTNGITAFASFIGAELVFPYGGSWTAGGLASVVSQGLFGPNSSTNAAIAAITLAANSPGPINIFTFSGGAQAYNTALGSLPSSIRGRINNVTYISPGSISNLAPGNGSTTVISNTFGAIDNAILWGSVGNAEMLETPCGHDSNCRFSNSSVQLALAQRSGGGCPANSAGGGGGGGGGGGNGGLSGYPPGWDGGFGAATFTEVVTSVITGWWPVAEKE